MLKRLFDRLTEKGTRMINVRKIDDAFDVSAQLMPEQLIKVSEMGYKTLICMRPDNEGANQPAFAEMERAARSVGIEPFYLPVVPGSITADQARTLKSILDKREGPVLAYCASGNRCAAAFELAKRV